MEGKLGNEMPLFLDDVLRPGTKAHCPDESWRRYPCFGDDILEGRNIVTFVEVWVIHGALGKGEGCHDGAAGVCGQRS